MSDNVLTEIDAEIEKLRKMKSRLVKQKRNHHAVLLFVPSQSRMWLCCNACGYDFRRKANGEADGKDVIEHKRGCRPDFRAIK